MKKQTIGVLCLLLATIIWGAAFVAQTAAADVIGSFTFNASRSLIAAVLLSVVLLFKEGIGAKKMLAVGGKSRLSQRKNYVKRSLISGGIVGIALFAAVNFQQFGIEKYPEGVSSSGRAGFLTATYVLFVALYTAIKNRRMHPVTIAACVGCVAGMYLLCVHSGVSKIYLGDVLEVLGALGFTLQILIIDRFSDTDGVALSCGQFWVTGVISAVCAAIFEEVSFSALAAAWLPVAYAGVLSSCVGYTLQILGQKHVKPTATSMLMSLESVFAALFGWIILREKLSWIELLGCALVFASVILSQLAPSAEKKASIKEESAKETCAHSEGEQTPTGK